MTYNSNELTKYASGDTLFRPAICRACGFMAQFKATVDALRGVRHCRGYSA